MLSATTIYKPSLLSSSSHAFPSLLNLSRRNRRPSFIQIGRVRAVASHIVGYPWIGPRRELKFALESFWDGRSSAEDPEKVAKDLRTSIWKQMADAGTKFIASNTFSYYDHILDMTSMLGAVPHRYGWTGGKLYQS